MVTHILVLAALLQLSTVAPLVISGHPSRDACFNAAGKANHSDPQVKTPKARAIGAAYVCLKLEYPV